MKKQLGKKAHVQEGTMTAFACDCISVCQSSAFCNCTSAATQSNTLNLCSICAADFGEDNDLSTSKKLQKCSVAKKEVEEHLVEYCTLREYGFNFEN